MADYTAGAGAGTIMLRDTGGNIEFWVQAGYSSTYFGSGGASIYYNGSWHPFSFSYESGAAWKLIYVVYIGTNQYCQVHLDSTGTSGLTGPADVGANIQRATVPAAPTMIGTDQIGHTSARVRFSGNSDGGSPIREWQIGYGTNPSSVQFTTGSGGTTVVGGLTMGVMWYFWARGRNDVGWSNWSGRAQARTLAGARCRVGGVWKEAVPWIRIAGTWRQAIPFVNVGGTWKPGQ